MRRDPAGWFISFVTMGYRRKSTFQRIVPRHLLLEQLEIRRLMTVDTDQLDGNPSSQDLHFEIIGAQAQQLFTVDTVDDAQNGLEAVLHPAVGQAANLNSAYTFDVALKDADVTVTTYHVEVTFPTATMVSGLQNYQQQQVETLVIDPAQAQLQQQSSDNGTELTADLDTDGSATATASQSYSDSTSGSLDDFASVAAEVAGQIGAEPSAQSRESAYAQFTQLLAASGNNPSADDDAEKIGATLNTMLDQLHADMASNDPSLAAAAQAAYSAALPKSDLSLLAWSGKGVNSPVYELDRTDLQVVQYSDWYETGQLQLLDQFAINLGRPAVVTVSVPENYPSLITGYSSLLTIHTGTAEAATYIDSQASGSSFGTANTIQVSNDGSGHQQDALVRFNLSTMGLSSQQIDSATLDLYATGLTGSPQDTAKVVPNNSWSENLTWSGDNTSVSSVGGAVASWSPQPGDNSIDVTDAVQRAVRLGDMNFSGDMDVGGRYITDSGDLAAFQLYLRNSASYMAEYGTSSTFADDILYRGDANDDGTLNASDGSDFLALHGEISGDVDFDGVVDQGDIDTVSANNLTSGDYGHGDANFDGIINGADIALIASNWNKTATLVEATPKLTLRIYDSSGTSASVTYASNDDSNPALRPTLKIDQSPDLGIQSFTATSDGQSFVVKYAIAGDNAQSFNIGVYRSADGTTNDELMTTFAVTGSTNLTPGPHTVTFSPGYSFDANEVSTDYYLKAVLNYDNQITEPTTDNNTATFQGGAFETPLGVVEVQGTDAVDNVAITGSSVSFNGGNFTIDIADATAVHVRVHGGNDVVSATSTLTTSLLLIGGAGNDQLTGGSGNDSLDGGAGNDTLTGGDGNDVYIFSGSVALGSDSIVESSGTAHGIDTLDFSQLDGGLGVTVTLSVTTAQTLNASLTLTVGNAAAIDNVIGTAYDDLLIGNALANMLTGGDGNDTLIGNEGNDTLVGGQGNDWYVFSGSANLGFDSIFEAAGQGTDTLNFSSLSAGVSVNVAMTATQTLNSSLTLLLSDPAAIDNVLGSMYDDTLIGNVLNNTFSAQAGNDYLEGGAGDDVLIGGTGSDTYVFSGSGDLGSDRVSENSGDAGTDVLNFNGLDAGISLDLTSGSTQTLNSSLSLALNVISGLSGIEDVIGTNYDDTIAGDVENNEIWGMAGDDNLFSGGAGNDILHGGTGNDILTDDNGAEGTTSVTLDGDDGDDLLIDDNGAEGAVSQTLSGGAGNDTYQFAASSSFAAVSIFEGANAGDDLLDFSNLSGGYGVSLDIGSTLVQTVNPSLTLTLSDAAGIDDVIGSQYADTITGNALANMLTGGPGNDSLAGGDGDDTYIFSGNTNLGSDTLTESAGAHGSDWLDFSALSSSAAFNLGLTTAQIVNPSLTLTLNNSAGFENVLGSPYADTISGNSLANILEGGPGNDTLVGADGDDTYIFSGSANLGTDTINETSGTSHGVDTLDFSGLNGSLGVSLNIGSTLTQALNYSLHLKLSDDAGIDNVIGTPYSDTISGNSLANALTGGSGDDTLAGGYGDDTYIFSGSANLGSDTVVEYSGTAQGVDTLDFSGLDGGQGVTVSMWATAAQVLNPSLTLTLSEPDISGEVHGEGIENLVGTSYADLVSGNYADNTIWGGAGNDIIWGGPGNDVIHGQDGDDELHGGEGADYHNDNDTLYGDAGNDTLFANIGTDYLYGGSGNDTLNGASGNSSGYTFYHGDDGLDSPEIIDDTDPVSAGVSAGFATSGPWTSVSLSTAFNKSEYTAAASASSTATWTFTGLPDGLYELLATWPADSNATTVAPFVVTGSTTETTLENQQQSPVGQLVAGAPWAQLGSAFFSPSAGMITVTLHGVGSGEVVADAVRLIPMAGVSSTPIDNVTAEEGDADKIIDVSSNFTDVASNAVLTYSVAGNTDTDIVTASISGSQLTLKFSAVNSGTADITIRATDQSGQSSEQTFAVTVNPVSNHAPTTAGISNLTVPENTPASDVNLLAAFSDIEDASSALQYQVTGNTFPGLFSSVNVLNGHLILDYAPNLVGSSTITVTAKDTGGKSVSATFSVSVTNSPPMVTSVSLLHDTGTNTTDRVTTDPTITGTVQSSHSDHAIVVQIDTNNDGRYDASVPVKSDGSFTYKPQGLTPGYYTFQVQAVDSTTGTNGSAVPFSFQLAQKTGPTIATLGLVSDTGLSSTDLVTSNPSVQGTITSDDSVANQRVEFDENGDGIADGAAYTNTGGSFTFTPNGLAFGSVTIQARGATWDSSTGQYLYGPWRPFTFQYVSPPGPTVTNLHLANDTGTSGDNDTTDPTLTGSLSYPGGTSYLTVQFDYNGDGQVSAATTTDASGNFTFLPVGLTPGSLTIHVRGVAWDTTSSQYIYGPWSAITFTLETDPTAPPSDPAQNQASDANRNSTATNADRSGVFGDGTSAVNSAISSPITTPGLNDVGIGTYDTRFLVAGSPLPSAVGAYDYQLGTLPTSAGLSPALVLATAPGVPANQSHSGVISVSDSGNASYSGSSVGTYLLSGPETYSWVETVDTLAHTFTIDVSEDFNAYTRVETGTYTETVGTLTNTHHYTRTLTGEFSLTFHATGSYVTTGPSTTLNGTYNVTEFDHDTLNFSDSVNYIDSGDSATGVDHVTGTGTYSYRQTEAAGTFSAAPTSAANSVSSGFSHTETGSYSFGHTAIDGFDKALSNGTQSGSHSHFETTSYIFDQLDQGSYTISGGSSATSVTNYVRHGSLSLSGSDTYPSTNYSVHYQDGVETGVQTENSNYSYSEQHSETGSYVDTPATYSVGISVFTDNIAGHTYDNPSVSGTFTPSGQPFTGPTTIISDQVTDDTTTYAASGSYTISAGTTSISATSFSSTQSQSQYYTYSAFGNDGLTAYLGDSASFSTGQLDSQTFYESDSGHFSVVNGSQTVDGSDFQTATQTYTLASTYNGNTLDGSSLTQQQSQNFTVNYWNTAQYHQSPTSTSSSGTATTDQDFNESSTYSAVHVTNSGSDTFLDWGSASAINNFHDSGTYLVTSGSAGATNSETGDQTLDDWQQSTDYDRQSGGYNASGLDGHFDQSQGLYISASQHQSGHYVDGVTTGVFTDDNATQQSGTYQDGGTSTADPDREANYNQYNSLSSSEGYHDAGVYTNTGGVVSQSGNFYSDETDVATAHYTDSANYSSDDFTGHDIEDNSDIFNATLHSSGTFTNIAGTYGDSATFTQTQTAVGTASFYDEGTYTDDGGGEYSSSESSSAQASYSASGWYVDDGTGHYDSATYVESSLESDTGGHADTRGYENAVTEGSTTIIANATFGDTYSETGWYTDSPNISSIFYTYTLNDNGVDTNTDEDHGTYAGSFSGTFSNSSSLSESMHLSDGGTVVGPAAAASTHNSYTLTENDSESSTHSDSFTETDSVTTLTVVESSSMSFSASQVIVATEDISPGGSYLATGTNNYGEDSYDWERDNENGTSNSSSETFTFQDDISAANSSSYSSDGSFTQHGFVSAGDPQITSSVEDGTFDQSQSTSYHETASDTDSITLYNGDTLVTSNQDDTTSVTTNHEYSAGYHDQNQYGTDAVSTSGLFDSHDTYSDVNTFTSIYNFSASYEDTGTTSFSESYSTSIVDDVTGGSFSSDPDHDWTSASYTHDEQTTSTETFQESANGSGYLNYAFNGPYDFFYGGYGYYPGIYGYYGLYGYYGGYGYYGWYGGWWGGEQTSEHDYDVDYSSDATYSYHETGSEQTLDGDTTSANVNFTENDFEEDDTENSFTSSASFSSGTSGNYRNSAGPTGHGTMTATHTYTYSAAGSYVVTPGSGYYSPQTVTNTDFLEDDTASASFSTIFDSPSSFSSTYAYGGYNDADYDYTNDNYGTTTATFHSSGSKVDTEGGSIGYSHSESTSTTVDERQNQTSTYGDNWDNDSSDGNGDDGHNEGYNDGGQVGDFSYTYSAQVNGSVTAGTTWATWSDVDSGSSDSNGNYHGWYGSGSYDDGGAYGWTASGTSQESFGAGGTSWSYISDYHGGGGWSGNWSNDYTSGDYSYDYGWSSAPYSSVGSSSYDYAPSPWVAGLVGDIVPIVTPYGGYYGGYYNGYGYGYGEWYGSTEFGLGGGAIYGLGNYGYNTKTVKNIPHKEAPDTSNDWDNGGTGGDPNLPSDNGQSAIDPILAGWQSSNAQPVCFAAGTPVRTAEGFKPIEEIQVGDLVLAVSDRDPAGPVQVRRVIEAFHNPPSALLNVHVGGQVIRATHLHPFYVHERGWTHAKDLEAGDLLRTVGGDWTPVTDLFDNGDFEPVYNLHVEEDHTYFVGSPDWDAGILVHNQSGGATAPQKPSAPNGAGAASMSEAALTREQVDAMPEAKRERLAKGFGAMGNAIQEQIFDLETQKGYILGNIRWVSTTIQFNEAQGRDQSGNREFLEFLNTRLSTTQSELDKLNDANTRLRNQFNALGLDNVSFYFGDEMRQFVGYDRLTTNEFQRRLRYGSRDGLVPDRNIEFIVGGLGAGLLNRVLARAAAARVLSAGGTHVAGSLTSAQVQELIVASGEETVTIFTKLTSAPQAGRKLFAAFTARLANAVGEGGRQLYSANIPRVLFKALKYEGLIREEITIMNGVEEVAVVIEAEAMQLLYIYFRAVGG
jgi:Ca2+-binding RTX toxin-like protein